MLEGLNRTGNKDIRFWGENLLGICCSPVSSDLYLDGLKIIDRERSDGGEQVERLPECTEVLKKSPKHKKMIK